MSGSIARSVQQVKGDLRSLVTPSQIMRQCQSWTGAAVALHALCQRELRMEYDACSVRLVP